jgi:hypothetical protein
MNSAAFSCRSRRSEIGHQWSWPSLLQFAGSLAGFLRNGHSIGATDFVGLNFGYAAVPVIGDDRESDLGDCCQGASSSSRQALHLRKIHTMRLVEVKKYLE